jgi:hypothetical protein
LKYFLQHLFDNHFVLNKLFENEVAYIPVNEKCIIENLIRTNIYRVSPLISNSLAILIRNMFIKSQYVDKAIDIIERVFDEIDSNFKKNEEEDGQISWS